MLYIFCFNVQLGVRLGQKRKGQMESTGRAVRISHISRIPQNTSFCTPKFSVQTPAHSRWTRRKL